MMLARALLVTYLLYTATACSENSESTKESSSFLTQSSWQQTRDFGSGQVETSTWHFYTNKSFIWDIRSDVLIRTKGRWMLQQGTSGVSALFLYLENNGEPASPRHILSLFRNGDNLVLGEQQYQAIPADANSTPDVSKMQLPEGNLVDHFPLWDFLTSNTWLVVEKDAAIDPDSWQFKKDSQYTMRTTGCDSGGTWSLLDITPDSATLRVSFPTQCPKNASSIIIREIPIRKEGMQLYFYKSLYSQQ